MLTFNDINRDFKAIVDGVTDVNRPVPSTLDALKITLIIPLVGVMLSTATFWGVCAQLNSQGMTFGLLLTGILSGDAIPVYMSAVVGVIQMLMLLPYANIYNSIPVDVRNNTALIAAFKKACGKGSLVYIALLLISCFASFYNELYLFSTPIIMFSAIIVTSIIVNLQVTKYGIGTLIRKMQKVIN